MSKLAKLVPLLDRVLVEKVAARTKTAGGLLLPDSAASKARTLQQTHAQPPVCAIVWAANASVRETPHVPSGKRGHGN